MKKESQQNIHKLFVISLALKAINGVLETCLGILFFFTSRASEWLGLLASNELVDDPNDFFATWLDKFLSHFGANAQMFAAFYLVSHGVIKVFLIWALFKNKVWAYPSSIAVFCLFIAYQTQRYFHTHSVFLLFLDVFDLFVIWLVWKEYQGLLKEKEAGPVA
jgi:uncharacterized membrane protein